MQKREMRQWLRSRLQAVGRGEDRLLRWRWVRTVLDTRTGEELSRTVVRQRDFIVQ